jgi:cell division protein FtsL
MAVIGARRANGFDVLLRRPRQRPRPHPARARARSSAHRREIGNVTGFLLAIAAAAALALFYLSQSTHVAATGYELDALQTRVQQLNRQQQQLVLQIGEARAPAQIESLAKSQLQLVPLNQKSVQFAPQPETAGLSGTAFDVPRAHRAAHPIER